MTQPGTVNRKDLLEALSRLYAEVDRLTGRLSRIHSGRLQCRRGCSACCVDGIAVYEIEARNIQRHHADLLEEETPRAEGACAFLDAEGGCRIYEQRPYVCRTQGLPLRWLEELDNGDIVEMRDICPLNDKGEPIETLDEEACWSIGPFEERLARLQAAADGGEMRRAALRELFVRQEPE